MNPTTSLVLRCAIAVAWVAYVMRQVRKPDSGFGRVFARAFNKSHETMTDWGLAHVTIESRFKILDVGCGGGRTVEKMSAIATSGMVYGVDYAGGSIAVSRHHNARMIAEGRVVIEKASVSKLPFPDNTFDLVTAIETQYYWPDLNGDMREILRVMRPGGKLVVIAEMYKGGKYDWLKWPFMWLAGSSHLSVREQRELFASAGYEQVEIFEEGKKGWICALGVKPGR